MKKSSTTLLRGILILFLTAEFAAAQLPQISSQQRPDIRAEAMKVENHFEVLLRNSLRNYYYPQSFIVDVNASLEEVAIPRDYERPRQIDQPVILDQLPGLPVLPENFTRKVDAPDDTLIPGTYDKALQISRLDILLVVDNSYSDDDREFVRTLARSVAKIDEFRGDVIRVESRNFPRDKRGLTPEQQAAERETAVAAEEAAEETEERRYAMPPPELDEAEVTESALLDYQNPLFLWGALGALLFFTLLLIGWVARNNRKSIQEEVQNETLMNPLLLELREELDKMKEEAQNREEHKNNEPTEEERARYQADCSFLINEYISHPKKVAGLLKQWISADDEGTHKAAKAIKSANAKLISTLRPSLDRNVYKSLESAMEDLPPMTLRERIDEARSFRKTLQSIDEETNNSTVTEDMFNFLNQMSDSQIQLLIKDESDDMVAILMAQLKGDRASKILQRFDKSKRAPILIKMGNIDNLPISAYKDIATHFSAKALEITNMKYVAADGVQSILSIIDELPVDQQEEYISSISETDLDLATKVKQFFVAFNDIPKVPDSVMEEALAEIETDTLVYALMNTDSEIYDKVMLYRPKREQMLIKSEMESRDDVTANEIEQGQKKLLLAIRSVMKKRIE